MFSVRNVLIPTDFSDTASPALEYALSIARTYKARLHVLHVVETSVFGPPAMSHSGFQYPIDKEEVLRRLQELRDKNPDVDIVTTALMGTAVDEIVSYAENNGIELICISTHGRRGFSRRLLGSTTEAVVRRAPCPVLSVHGDQAIRREEAE